MIKRFYINSNNFLEKNITAYYHQEYTGYRNPGNPDFLNTLKNTFDNTPKCQLNIAKDRVLRILKDDLRKIISENNTNNWVCISVPRAKSIEKYSDNQLMFKSAIKETVAGISDIVDSTDYISRTRNTRTTHLRNVENNDGDMPYPGITKDTCDFNVKEIRDKHIILIDDIYTKNVNIDEDCIQALLDCGAKVVIFYAIGKTRGQL